MSKDFPSTMGNPSSNGAGHFGAVKKTNLPPNLKKQEEALEITEDMDIKGEEMETLEETEEVKEETDDELEKEIEKEVKENEELIDELVLDDPLQKNDKSKEVEGK